MAFKAKALDMKIAGPTTPSAIVKPIKTTVAKTIKPLGTKGVGSNAQTQAMQNAITKTYKKQQTFGVPGAK